MITKLRLEHVVAPKSGYGFAVRRGELVRFVDLEGLQVMDFVAFNTRDKSEKFSQTHTRLHNNFKYNVSKGDVLFSNRDNAMFTITDDKFGRHDLYFTSCNRTLYRNLFDFPPNGQGEPYDGCFEHLFYGLEKFEITKDELPDPFNINMRTKPDFKTNKFVIELPNSKPGDFISVKAEMDCIVGITSCSEEISPCNGGRSTPIKVQVFRRK